MRLQFSAQLLLAVILNLITAITPEMALAMQSCDGIDATSNEKLVISRLVAAGLSDAEQTMVSNFVYGAALQVTIDLSNTKKLPHLWVVSCNHSSPNIDGSDFQPALVEELNERHVLYDVWGNLLTHKINNKTAAEGPLAYFIKIPDTDSIPPWPATAKLNCDYHAAGQSMKDLFEGIFSQGHHFEILTAVAVGIVERRNGHYGPAQAAFCRAVSLLAGQKSQDRIWRDLDLDVPTLVAAIEHLAKDNFDNAPAEFKNTLRPKPMQTADTRVCPNK